MDNSQRILNELIKVQERSDAFRHGREEVFDGINLAEVHCIDWIGGMNEANVTKIANEMGMTRGAISKITKKLQGKELVEHYQRPENNKEIYFRLTERGKRVYDEHKTCHERSRREKLGLLAAYDDNEQAVILHFLNAVNRLFDNKQAEKNEM